MGGSVPARPDYQGHEVQVQGDRRCRVWQHRGGPLAVWPVEGLREVWADATLFVLFATPGLALY